MSVSERHYSRRVLYYDGQKQESLSPDDNTFKTIDPATAQPLADVVTATTEDVDAAIASAKQAFKSWSQTPAIERSRILHKAVALLRKRNDQLAEAETRDTGKPFSETGAVDVVTGADVLEYYANIIGAGGLEGERIKLRQGVWINSTREPLGVCAGIGAWNYPIQIALWKSAPCLAAGNTMVYKPSEFTPLHAQFLAEIYTEAGVPPGVFNVINGDGKTGAYLTAHPDIAKVSFTGQVSTGKKVAGSAAEHLKYVTMELGGKSPLLVLDDCDVSAAVDGAMMANFYSTGQVCTNGTRVFVPRSMRDAFHAKLAEKIGNVRIGDLMHADTNLGPLSSKVHHEKVLGFISRAIEDSRAKLLHGGLGQPDGIPRGCENGYWVRPTVFTDVTDDMEIAQQEVFGPVMSILFYDTLEEAIKRANNTSLGLAAGVFTRDLDRAQLVVDQLEAGITWINTWGESPAEMSVGGWKQSGLGVENGRHGINEWTRNKSTLVDTSGQFASVFGPKTATKL